MKIWDAFTEAEQQGLDEAGFAALLASKYGYTVEQAEEAAAIAYGGTEDGINAERFIRPKAERERGSAADPDETAEE